MKIGFRGKYDFVCGIGHYCATANFLKRNYLRRLSGPFDWNAQDGGRGLDITTGLIVSGFAGFLEKGSLVKLDRSLSPLNDPECDYYRDEKSGVTFYHDFPLGAPMELVYDRVKAKYDRRIARFYETVKSSSRTLLVFQTRYDHPAEDRLVVLLTRLRQRLGEQVDLLVIEDIPNLIEPCVTETVQGLFHVRCWFFKPEMHWIYGDLRLNDSVYRQIPMHGKLKQRLRILFLRFCASLHVSREKRHAARKRLLG